MDISEIKGYFDQNQDQQLFTINLHYIARYEVVTGVIFQSTTIYLQYQNPCWDSQITVENLEDDHVVYILSHSSTIETIGPIFELNNKVNGCNIELTFSISQEEYCVALIDSSDDFSSSCDDC